MANKALIKNGKIVVIDRAGVKTIPTVAGGVKSIELTLTENSMEVDIDTTSLNLNGLFQISYIVDFGSVNNEVCMRVNNRTDSIYRNIRLDITHPAYNNQFWTVRAHLNKLWCIRNCSMIGNELILDSSTRGHTITDTYTAATAQFNTDGLNESSINSIKFYSPAEMQVGSIFKITKIT